MKVIEGDIKGCSGKKINNEANKAEWENCEKFTTYFSREHLTAQRQ